MTIAWSVNKGVIWWLAPVWSSVLRRGSAAASPQSPPVDFRPWLGQWLSAEMGHLYG